MSSRLHKRLDQLETKDQTNLAILTLHPDYLTREQIESANEAEMVILIQNYRPLDKEQTERMLCYSELIETLFTP